MSKIIELSLHEKKSGHDLKPGMSVSLMKAANTHLRLDNEDMSSFARGYKALTPQDKTDLAEQFEREFGYKIDLGNLTPAA